MWGEIPWRKNMTKKSDEPRIMIKIPASLHAIIKHRAWKRQITMMNYLGELVNKDQPKTADGDP